MSQRRLLEQELAHRPCHGLAGDGSRAGCPFERNSSGSSQIRYSPIASGISAAPADSRGADSAGRAGHLKERTLGVEVFGRQPDYDTNTDR